MKLTKGDCAFILAYLTFTAFLACVVANRYDIRRAARLQQQIAALQERASTCAIKLGAIGDFVRGHAISQDGRWYRMSVAQR